jgi:hypothetical protein
MIIYCNGDSYIAGVELGDHILPDHPGYMPQNLSPEEYTVFDNWIQSTYADDYKLRDEHYHQLIRLEREACFSGILSSRYGYNVVNNALGGASMERITRTTITDLINLKKTHKDIIAIIGTTEISRTEFPHETYGWEPFMYNQKFFKDYYAENLRQFKLQYQKDYHDLIYFYKNAILIQDFCKLNDIKLFWIATSCNINEYAPEEEYKNEIDFLNFKEYLNLKYTLDMSEEVHKSNIDKIYCPSYHYSPETHELFAHKLNTILQDYT